MNPVATAPARRAYWLKTLHQWHWISSAICLIGMLLFAITGITLNHAADIPAHNKVERRSGTVPAELKQSWAAVGDEEDRPVPEAVADWFAEHARLNLAGVRAEWSPDEIYLPLPQPGADAWLRIDRGTGDFEYERTDRGWIAYFNDLHKGRDTGAAWRWFIDIFAVACLVFCVTGLLILKMHATQRPSTWPMVALGLVLPLLLVILFIH